jgi:hypothetical protein
LFLASTTFAHRFAKFIECTLLVDISTLRLKIRLGLYLAKARCLIFRIVAFSQSMKYWRRIFQNNLSFANRNLPFPIGVGRLH